MKYITLLLETIKELKKHWKEKTKDEWIGDLMNILTKRVNTIDKLEMEHEDPKAFGSVFLKMKELGNSEEAFEAVETMELNMILNQLKSD